MDVAKSFPTVVWLFRIFTGRMARRIYLIVFFLVLVLLLCVPTVPRIRNAYRAWKFQKVLAGLERVKVDQTTEAELIKLVPYLKRGYSGKDTNGNVETWYAVEFSNEFDWSADWVDRFLRGNTVQNYERAMKTARMLGAWFLSFGAGVKVRNGTVARVGYGINPWGGWPRAIGETISVKSVHGAWLPYRRGFEVSSVDDQNPQLRIWHGRGFFGQEGTNVNALAVRWTPDAPSALLAHLYHINLSCAWSLHGCVSARDIAPLLWHDAERTEAATRARLESPEQCPDRILADRVRYLPDVDVLLLELVDSRGQDRASAGQLTERIGTEYRLIGVVRGPASWYASKTRLRYHDGALWPSEGPSSKARSVPLPLENSVPPDIRPGDRLLFFTNLTFESCQLVPATPSALSAVRNTPGAPRLPEDQIPMGLQ